MRNAEGHEIKIAHGALSPKFRGQLAALPLAEGGDVDPRQPGAMNMAEGGDTSDERANDQDLVDSTQNDDLARMVEKESMDKRAYARGGKVKMYAGGANPVDSKDDSPEQIASDAAAQAPAAQPQSPVNIQINPTPAPNAAPPSAQQGSADSAPQSAQPQQAPAAAAPQAPQDQSAQMPPTVQGGPSAGQVPQDSSMPEYPTLQAPVIQQGAQQVANQQDMARQAYIQRHMTDTTGFAEDLNNGHISPKSYGEIADKHTLGRIGTMFGMLLGGIGSGLSGQPNALMGMMDKEIDRDLTAQQNSKSNAQNLYNLTSQRVTAEANAGLTNVTSAERVLAQAKVNYQVMALHKMVEMTKRLPPGPQKQAGEQAIAMMAGKIRDGEYQMLDKMYAMEQLGGGGGNSTGNETALDPQEAAFQARNAALSKSDDPHNIAVAQYEADRHIPGIPGFATDKVPEHDKSLLLSQNTLDQKGKDLLSYINQHKGLDWHRWSPNDRAIATQKVEEMKNFYNNSIGGGALTEGRLGWYDEQFAKHPLDIIPQLLGSTAKFKEVIDSNAMRRDTMLKSLGYKGFPKNSPLLSEPSPSRSQSTPSKDSGMIERSWNGRTALYDQNKKFIRYK